MLKPSNSVLPTQRMEVISLVFEKIDPADPDMDSDSDKWDPYPDDHPSDIKDSCRILIADIYRVHEIYNPEKLIDFTVLPTQMQPSDHDAGFQNIPKRRRLDVDSTSGYIDLPLTGPIRDIKPFCGFFTFIVHQDTCNEKLLEENINRYIEGLAANPGVKSYVSVITNLSFDKPLNFEFRDDFFSLTLDCIVFRDSKLVTVSVKWLLMDDNIGGDAKKTQATKTTHICGKLYFHSSAFDTTSVLLETPEDKAIEVEHGKPIPLLRSAVAVPYMSNFEVEASLLDPINNFDVNGSRSFVQSEENILQTFSHCFCGNGAQIEVEITMKPNDLEFESWQRHK